MASPRVLGFGERPYAGSENSGDGFGVGLLRSMEDHQTNGGGSGLGLEGEEEVSFFFGSRCVFGGLIDGW